jgi:hypothetical protein
MKKKLLSIILAGVIMLSTISTVSADTHHQATEEEIIQWVLDGTIRYFEVSRYASHLPNLVEFVNDVIVPLLYANPHLWELRDDDLMWLVLVGNWDFGAAYVNAENPREFAVNYLLNHQEPTIKEHDIYSDELLRITVRSLVVSVVEYHDGRVYVDVCRRFVSDELLAKWVADGTIPLETTKFTLCSNYCSGSLRCDGDEPILSDLTPFGNLPNLTELWFSSGNVTDVSPLAGLSNLQRLCLSANQISDLTPLAEGDSLKWLRLDCNQITDVSPLAGLTNLGFLSLCENPLTDVSALDGLTIPRLWWDGGDDGNYTPVQLLGLLIAGGHATVHDAIEILRFAVDLPSILDTCPDAFASALIVSEDEPGVADAIAILRSLVGLPSALDNP